jgi:deoxyadenosine/deoxycytidine kinase
MYVSFEGPIAAGKTTLAKRFHGRLGLDALLLLEQFEENPFLASYYQDRERWSLAMQLDFLVKRHRQLSCHSILSVKHALSDHSMIKDLVFARLLLNGDELSLYRSISDEFPSQAVSPNIFVYLDAPNEVLLERIRDRGRPYEQTIDSIYLDSLRAEYEKAFSAMGRIVRLDTTTFSQSSPADLDRIWETIQLAIGSPTCSA